MQARGKLIAILMVTAVVLGALPFTAAESDSMRVIMTSDSGEYQVGDTIQVFIHVFEKGLPDDADSIEVTLVTHWQHFPVNLTAQRVSRGLYSVSYTVQDGDYYANFHADVVVGNDVDSADLNLDVVTPGVEVSVMFDHSSFVSANPGDTLQASVLVTYRGNPVDADSFDPLQVVYGDGTYENLTANRISPGHYNISVPIKNIHYSDNAVLRVDAHYVNDHSMGTAQIFINPMGVWYHPISLTGGTATFKLGVADSMGRAVSGADIYLDNNGHMDRTHYITDSNGTATIIVPQTYEGAHISGYVLNGSMNQSFNGMINNEPDQIPNPNGHHFDVIPTTLVNYYNVSETITREYTAYNNSVPMQNKVIYYYIVSSPYKISEHLMGIDGIPNKVVRNGSATTDDLGKFTLNLPAPANQSVLNIFFEAPIGPNQYNYNPLNPNDHLDTDDNMVYEEDQDTIYVMGGNPWNSPDVRISVGSLVLGGPTSISVVFPTPTEKDVVFLAWSALNDADSAAIKEHGGFMSQFNTVQEWQPWTGSAGFVPLHRTDGGTFTGTAYIPAFMGGNQNISFMGLYVDVNSGLEYGNIVVVAPGQGGSSTPAGPGSYLLPLLIAIIVIAGAAILLFMKRKEKKPQTFQSHAEPPTITEAQAPPMQGEGGQPASPGPQEQEYIPWQPESRDGKPPVF